MKQIIYASLIVVIASVFAAAQNEKSNCPKIEVRGGEMVKPGQPMSFTAELSDEAKRFRVEYEWKISAGNILSGERNSSVAVDTTGLANGVNVRATVRVKGLPVGCANESSAIGSTIPEMIGSPYDNYGKLSFERESVLIDGFLADLTNNPKVEGLVAVNLGKDESIEEGKKYLRKILNHLKFRNFPLHRVTFTIKESDERSTTLWSVPPRAKIRKCKECLIFKAEDF